MRVSKYGCDITWILIGYALSDVRFDWLVANMSEYQEYLFRSRSKKTTIFLHLSDYFREMFYKSKRGLFFRVSIASSKHSGCWENSRQLCKSSTTSRVCIAVSNSLNYPCVQMKQCKQGKVLYCLVKPSLTSSKYMTELIKYIQRKYCKNVYGGKGVQLLCKGYMFFEVDNDGIELLKLLLCFNVADFHEVLWNLVLWERYFQQQPRIINKWINLNCLLIAS